MLKAGQGHTGSATIGLYMIEGRSRVFRHRSGRRIDPPLCPVNGQRLSRRAAVGHSGGGTARQNCSSGQCGKKVRFHASDLGLVTMECGVFASYPGRKNSRGCILQCTSCTTTLNETSTNSPSTHYTHNIFTPRNLQHPQPARQPARHLARCETNAGNRFATGPVKSRYSNQVGESSGNIQLRQHCWSTDFSRR